MTRIEMVRARLLADPPPPIVGAAWVLAAVALPTLVRLSVDPIVTNVTFVTYYPFVLVAAMFLGWRYALGVVTVAAVVANFLFMAPRFALMAGLRDTLGALFFFLSSSLLIAVAEGLRRTLREVEAGRRREAELNTELQHRVRNMLTIVQGLAGQSFKATPQIEPAVRTFRARLYALAQANEVLSSDRWEACAMPALAERALAPFRGQGALRLAGPACTLPEAACVPLVLALHELGTNAVKYGALSVREGSVDLTWTIRDGALALHWRERGGPPVQEPTRRGLGSRLLSAQRALSQVTVDYAPEGVVCEIMAPGARPA